MIKSIEILQQLEKKIADKYGEFCVTPPKALWDQDKEQQYLDQLKMLANKEEAQKKPVEKIDGIIIEKKLLKNNSVRTCSCCNRYSMKSYDDLTLIKYGLCLDCYNKKDFKINEG